MPTFDDVNELTTSGAFPERSAAMILSSLIEPTTLTSTFGVLRVVLRDDLLELAELAGAPADPDGQLRRASPAPSPRTT